MSTNNFRLLLQEALLEGDLTAIGEVIRISRKYGDNFQKSIFPLIKGLLNRNSKCLEYSHIDYLIDGFRKLPEWLKTDYLELVAPILISKNFDQRLSIISAFGSMHKDIPAQCYPFIVSGLLNNAITHTDISTRQVSLQSLASRSGSNTAPSKDFIAYLMTNHACKEALISNWSNVLKGQDIKEAKKASDFILQNFEEFGLLDSDPIIQEAINVQTLLGNLKDPLNPYTFFAKLKQKRDEIVIVDPNALPKETYDGISISINPDYLKSLNEEIIFFKDLPDYDKNFFDTMKLNLELRLKTSLKSSEINKKFQTVIDGALKDNCNYSTRPIVGLS